MATKKNTETYYERCMRLREEAEAGCDEPSALFFTAMNQAMALRIPEENIGACLALLLNRKFVD